MICTLSDGIEITPISENKPAEGNQLNVICKGQSNPELKDDDVTWTKQKNNTFSSKGKQLLIQNVNKVDSGIYICSAVIKITPTDGLPQNLTGRTTVDVDVLCKYYIHSLFFQILLLQVFSDLTKCSCKT